MRSDEEIKIEIQRYKERNNAYMRKYKRNNRQKVNARKNVYDALRLGWIVKTPCHCGETKVEGHHPDYSKPLEVIWLCKKHHNALTYR